MKVVFFFPKIPGSYRVSYAPIGIMSIASYLNANGHEAVICDRVFSKDSIEGIIEAHKPDIIGVSIISHTFLRDAIEISRTVHSMGIPVAWGGTIPTSTSHEVLASGYVDYISMYEGEETWLEMANAFDKGESFDGIKGLAYLKDGEYTRTEDREFMDLAKLPDIDWSLVNPSNYFQKFYGCNKMLVTYYSKGCPNRCTYCYNPGFNKSHRRCRPLQQVINEMCHLVKTYGADGFDFTDDCMFLTHKELVDFCEAILACDVKFSWGGYLSVGIANTQEDFDLMYKAGCRSIIFGIESGSPKILKSVNKHNKNEKVKDNVDLCVKAGIVPVTAFMIGLPGETEGDLMHSLNLAKSLDGAAVLYNFFTPLPGSTLYGTLDFNKPKTTDELAVVHDFEGLFQNFTNVPTKELFAIKNYIRLRTLFTPVGNSSSEQLSKVILSSLKSWSEAGFSNFIRSTTVAVFNVLETFTIFFQPKIRKKYGLYFKK